MPTEGSYSVKCNRSYGIKNDSPLSTTVAPALRVAVVLDPPASHPSTLLKLTPTTYLECISLECERAAGTHTEQMPTPQSQDSNPQP